MRAVVDIRSRQTACAPVPTPVPQQTLINDRILRIKQVKERTGLSRSAIYRGIARGTFPAQQSLGCKAVGWRDSVISEWIAAGGQGGDA